jgi:nucleotide-binding universal stress UspA family protein
MKNILVALDLSTERPRIMQQATELGRSTGAKLWLVHVAAPDPDFVGFDAGPQYVRDERAGELHQEHRHLERLCADLSTSGIHAQPVLVAGPTAQTILELAAKYQVDLIIMGSHGRRGLAKAFLGSTSDDVLRANRFPVLVVPTPANE